MPLTLPAYVSLCDYNRYHYDKVGDQYIKGAEIQDPKTGGAGARDQKVGEVCTKGENIKTVNTAFIVATAAMGLSTLVFTGVLLIHRKNKNKGQPKDEAFFRRRGLSLGVAPRPEGGFTFGGGLRF